MRRRGFLGALLGAALAPRALLAPAEAVVPTAYYGGRVDVFPQVMFARERVVVKMYPAALYGKLSWSRGPRTKALSVTVACRNQAAHWAGSGSPSRSLFPVGSW